LLAILARVDERLAGYLQVIGLAGSQRRGARLAAGQFHDVVLAGQLAYRFPRDEQSRRKLPGAVRLLEALSRTGVAVPVPVAAGNIDAPLGRCHVALTRLPGEPLDFPVSPRAQDAVAGQLAGLLDRLAVLGRDRGIRQLVPRVSADHWLAFASQVRHVLFPLMSGSGRLRAEAELAAVAAVAAAGDALVHTDLGGTNLLWTTTDGVPRLTGVLDWDECGIGNQANDLASIGVTIGWPLAERIDDRRRSAAGRPALADAKIIAATFALQQALPAALIADTVNLDDGLRQYR
jgi:aminoglycoside phosphotransferase (APT) family kinase protein